jgi:hypothetical protein
MPGGQLGEDWLDKMLEGHLKLEHVLGEAKAEEFQSW